MKHKILLLIGLSLIVSLSCSYPFFTASFFNKKLFNRDFNFRQYIYYDNIVEYAIVDTALLENRFHVYKVQPIDTIRITDPVFNYYMPDYHSQGKLKGDTMLIFYKRISSEFYHAGGCREIQIYKNDFFLKKILMKTMKKEKLILQK